MNFGLREALFIVLLLAIPAGAWWLVFHPNNERNDRMQARIAQRQEKLKRLNRTTAVIGDLKREIGSLREAVAFLRSRLPSEKEMDKVLEEIWKLAERNDLQTKSIRTLDRGDGLYVPTGSPHSEQPIAVELTGDFRGFYAFLQALENQPRIMRIRTMKLTRPKDGPPGHVQAAFEMYVFFEPSEEPAL